MFGGFFNRMYYGNPNKPDLKRGDTQIGRFKLFFTVLQVRFWKLIQLNLLYSLFWIPAFAVLYINLMAAVESPSIIEMAGNMQSFWFAVLLFLIPFMVIAGPATAGAVYVIRNWARDEHAWLWSDFKDVWKQNWKQSLLIMLINGLVLITLYVNINFYAIQAQQNLIYVVLHYLILMMGIIYAMMNMFIFPMLVTYKLKTRQIFKNALIFTMAELPRAFVIFVLAFAIFGIVFYFSFPFIIPFFIVGLTFPMLIAVSFANWVFDKYLNKESGEKEEEESLEGSEVTGDN
ncbi:MAG TPA: DUF624 domain-containing protein [Clostridia bacterium]|nr:DUF624 domain-containing protein [Clostridia bacterium]